MAAGTGNCVIEIIFGTKAYKRDRQHNADSHSVYILRVEVIAIVTISLPSQIRKQSINALSFCMNRVVVFNLFVYLFRFVCKIDLHKFWSVYVSVYL